jgi:demethylmenaquinone methyltransferase / 2-methoxy-6-polyprenyl-1,4-benzoquinol methylase
VSRHAPVLGSDDALPEGDAKHAAVEAMFDRVAPGYERMNRIISLGLDKGWRRRAIEALELGPGARVLDLACGTGDLCRDLTAAGCSAIGVDFSAGMLAVARVEAPLVRGDAAATPFPDGVFDGVVCGFALRNFIDLDVVFRQCARVLRRGGRFVALDAAVPENGVMRIGNAVWFRGAVPLLGRVLSRDPSAYRYLPRSTAYLPDGPELVAELERAGFEDATRTTFTGGSVQLLAGTRA